MHRPMIVKLTLDCSTTVQIRFYLSYLELGHCPTSRKIAGSIPDGSIGIFHRLNPSSRPMTLGSTQPLT